MRFLRAFAIALITALAGAFLAIFASDYLTRLYRVSDMEGQRGTAVVFLFAPLGLIVGFAIGLIVSLRSRRPGFAGFLFAQGLSILSTIALTAAVSGFAWLGADHYEDGRDGDLFTLAGPDVLERQGFQAALAVAAGNSGAETGLRCWGSPSAG